MRNRSSGWKLRARGTHTVEPTAARSVKATIDTRPSMLRSLFASVGRLRYLARVGLVLSAVLCVCLSATARAEMMEPPLPGKAQLEPHRLILFIHGYISDADAQAEFVDVLTKEGVPAELLYPESRGDIVRYHGHSFDFSNFTRAGSDHNSSEGVLANAFSNFYHNLTESCQICHDWEGEPVQVTLIGHSFGGVIVREFLMLEEELGQHLAHLIPGAVRRQSPWRITRVITLGSPWFGSVKTRFTQGFLQIVLNGLVRTVVLGFVNPQRGGVFGNVVDEQARALRIGSPFLWDSQLQWNALTKRVVDRGGSVPAWLVVIAVSKRQTERKGDGITRFASANLQPLCPNAPMETLVVDMPHRKMVRLKDRGRTHRNQRDLLHAITRFIEMGSLANDTTGTFRPFQITAVNGIDRIVPAIHVAIDSALFRPTKQVRQIIYMSGSAQEYFDYFANPGAKASVRPSLPLQSRAHRDFESLTRRLERILNADTADVWLRFYEGIPSDMTHPPRVLSLQPSLTFFRNGVERSRDWADLQAVMELNGDGETIPTTQFLAPVESHLIAIPDVTPTGIYRLWIRLEKGVIVKPDHVRVEVEGHAIDVSEGAKLERVSRVYLRPHQANLIHVYLDGASIREEYPELRRIRVREIALNPDVMAMDSTN